MQPHLQTSCSRSLLLRDPWRLLTLRVIVTEAGSVGHDARCCRAGSVTDYWVSILSILFTIVATGCSRRVAVMGYEWYVTAGFRFTKRMNWTAWYWWWGSSLGLIHGIDQRFSVLATWFCCKTVNKIFKPLAKCITELTFLLLNTLPAKVFLQEDKFLLVQCM